MCDNGEDVSEVRMGERSLDNNLGRLVKEKTLVFGLRS